MLLQFLEVFLTLLYPLETLLPLQGLKEWEAPIRGLGNKPAKYSHTPCQALYLPYAGLGFHV